MSLSASYRTSQRGSRHVSLITTLPLLLPYLCCVICPITRQLLAFLMLFYLLYCHQKHDIRDIIVPYTYFIVIWTSPCCYESVRVASLSDFMSRSNGSGCSVWQIFEHWACAVRNVTYARYIPIPRAVVRSCWSQILIIPISISELLTDTCHTNHSLLAAHYSYWASHNRF